MAHGVGPRLLKAFRDETSDPSQAVSSRCIVGIRLHVTMRAHPISLSSED